MRKITLVFVVALVCGSVYASSESDTIKRIESKRNVQCSLNSVSSTYCLNHACYTWKKYRCDSLAPNGDGFIARLRIRQILNEAPEVTLVTYLKR